MIPFYEAIEVVEIIPRHVGRNMPWVVRANTPQGLQSFVVKLYDHNQVEDQHIITREVISAVLATEFDLIVPEFSLMIIPPEITLRLDHDPQLQYINADERPKFATCQLSGVKTAISGLKVSDYKKRIDLDTLYAFDNFIRNSDRGHPKMNLLMGKSDAFLIDHEFALLPKDILNVDITKTQLEDRFTKYHLFYPYLRNMKAKSRKSLFHDFIEYMKMLNINNLYSYFECLAREGFSDYSQPIINWINHIFRKFSYFC